ncbi:MAG: histidine--tRNA ligase [Candidatus Gracilibacteria bacterium]|nr:histidine--tRNA ligase [Candidatus Gracilibacteria bacterium]
MISPKAISGFSENLPEEQLIENKFHEIIKENYAKSGFTPLDTPVIERVETLTAKGADDNEVYGIHRLNGDISDDASLGLRFDLTVPFARYVAQNQGVLSFPFKRQHIARVYRGERPQKGRYREFYQADVDIVGSESLSLFADVEVVSTIYNSLRELDFGAFVIHINNKKFLQGFLESIQVSNISEIISIIDKKDKVRNLKELFETAGLEEGQIAQVFEYIKISNTLSSEEILSHYSDISNRLFLEGKEELQYLYDNLLILGVDPEYIKIDTSISRGLNYYTGTVFETFITESKKMGSISSGGRYENLCGNFTDKSFPGVGGSIGLSRLIAVLQAGKNPIIEPKQKTTTQVLVLNTSKELFAETLSIVKNLRDENIATEIYLDDTAKFKKQLKYADNKKIPYVVIFGEEEAQKGVVQLKKLETGEQFEIALGDLPNSIK